MMMVFDEASGVHLDDLLAELRHLKSIEQMGRWDELPASTRSILMRARHGNESLTVAAVDWLIYDNKPLDAVNAWLIEVEREYTVKKYKERGLDGIDVKRLDDPTLKL